jgi:hypothetical protein
MVTNTDLAHQNRNNPPPPPSPIGTWTPPEDGAFDVNEVNEPHRREVHGFLPPSPILQRDHVRLVKGLLMRIWPWLAARAQDAAQPRSPNVEKVTELVRESDEDGDDTMSASRGSDEDVEEPKVEVANPGGVMKSHHLRRNSKGELVHACCGRQDDGAKVRDKEEQEPRRET